MELGSYLLHCGSSQHQREFEFQMSTASLQREATTSPADELFYKGKLLPLHLPPRIEMVEQLLGESVSAYEEFYGTPLATTVSTPFESCNVSPCESCCISRELSPEAYLCEFSTDMVRSTIDYPKKSWSRNIKKIKQRLFGPKRNGSRAFFKSLLGKSGCSDDSSAAAAKVFVAASSRRRDESNPQKGDGFRRVQPSKESAVEDSFSFRQHRRSLSLSSRWRQSNKICSSSFSSSSSSSSSSLTSALKERDRSKESASWERIRLTYADAESPIQAAIAYCKQSQKTT